MAGTLNYYVIEYYIIMSIESGSKNTFNNIDNIPITDLSQDITGGTNITTSGQAPIVINNDNIQN